MRSFRLINLTIFFFIIAIINHGCKKTSGDFIRKSTMIEESKAWFEVSLVKPERELLTLPDSILPKKSNLRRFARMQKIGKHLLWSRAQEFQLRNVNFVIVPLDENENSFKNSSFRGIRSLAFYRNTSGKLTMDIIEVIAKGEGSFDSNKLDIFKNAFANKMFTQSTPIGKADLYVLFYDSNYRPTGSFKTTRGTWSKTDFRLVNESKNTKRATISTLSTIVTCSGSCTTYYLVGYWYDMQTGVVVDYEILDTWDECTNGSAPPNYGSWVYYELQAILGRLCQNYQFKTTGNSYSATINNLMYTFRSPAGVEHNVNFGSSCLSIPTYGLSTTDATAYFNIAFNSAVDEVVGLLNSKVITAMQIHNTLKSLTQANLRTLQSGSVWSSAGACAGDIPVTNIGTSSFCK